MTASQIKSELNKTISGLSPSKLKKVYSAVNNIVKENTEEDDWAPDVSKEEIAAIEIGLAQLAKGQRTPAKKVMDKMRRKYS